MIVAEIILCLCVLAMFHSYVLYPWLLRLFSTGKKPNAIVYERTDDLPEVFVLFSAFNEQRVITEKLESIFNTNYPLSKLQVYVGSDNSTDNTDDIINAFAARYPQLHFTAYRERNGKANVLNKLVKQMQERGLNKNTAVFVSTDANVMFTPDTLFELAKHFKNEQIGQVGANILNKGMQADGISFQEMSYIQRENHIKYLEGLNWGSMMGAFGACHAVRASCWQTLPSNFLMEDFYLSMGVLKQRKKAIKELQAVCYEDVSNEVEEEYKRKTRIQAGNFQNLSVYWPLLFRFNAVSFSFLSHKVIRWFGPVFIAAAYLSNFWLLMEATVLPQWLYVFTFAAQNLLLLSPFIDKLLQSNNVHLKILRFVSYFYWMNLALVKGFIMFAGGIKTNAWSPTKRNVD